MAGMQQQREGHDERSRIGAHWHVLSVSQCDSILLARRREDKRFSVVFHRHVIGAPRDLTHSGRSAKVRA